MKDNKYSKEIVDIRKALSVYHGQVKRPANGFLKHDYLVPSGYYSEQWDWDAYFMGVGLTSHLKSEAIYLRNWALNYLNATDSKGFTPGCITFKGPEKGHRFFLMKPFLAQGVYIAANNLNDFAWIKPHWATLKKIVTYRRKHRWNKKYGMVLLKNSMETGADDNVAALDFPDYTVAACDMNIYTLREYKAMALLAKKFGKLKDAEVFDKYYKDLKNSINKYLWDREDKIYYNLDTKSGNRIKRISFSCFVPLWEGTASSEDGRESIKRYLLSEAHMKTEFGLTSLSKLDKEYNNVNRIHPYSNWQGPVWPIANYFYLHALINYGFNKEAVWLSKTITKLVLNDIQKTGGMHENYDAETGKPLAADNFVSWNLLVSNMLEEAVENKNPFKI